MLVAIEEINFEAGSIHILRDLKSSEGMCGSNLVQVSEVDVGIHELGVEDQRHLVGLSSLCSVAQLIEQSK